MKLEKRSNIIYDEKGRALAKIDFYQQKRHLRRTCACTIGEYFAILCWLMDNDEQIAFE